MRSSLAIYIYRAAIDLLFFLSKCFLSKNRISLAKMLKLRILSRCSTQRCTHHDKKLEHRVKAILT
ncbi:hypothetical protein THIOM_003814 [Candidatus Thiomargarita nelsonii]|uniref:Uncharacterized protein n=1 Tax=Candidatus Thiomargarita nelsonii TaxID=1003181 RepID=A0A176RXH3_9GAMM|nr:hypothetical protein THIOM_003814 [Candidatus Thiomargarita nelsonii]